MKRNKIFLLAFLILSLINSASYSQTSNSNEWELIATVNVPNIHVISTDPYNNIYIGDKSGNIIKTDATGKIIHNFSPSRKGEIALLEAWRSVNIFAFYRELQTYTILDRFLNTSSPATKFNRDLIGFARLASFSSDNNLWIIDDIEFSLKKLNLSFQQLDVNTRLDLLLDPQQYDLNFMREYQNLLFINDKNSGILIFDNLGNYKTTLPHKGLDFFCFDKNNIYFLTDNTIKSIDVYTYKETSIPLPDGNFKKAIIGKNEIYLFSDHYFSIYKK
ncbi:MAG TPA: hypothetical protein VIK89_15375 [Cytophagaceae bacterium]